MALQGFDRIRTFTSPSSRKLWLEMLGILLVFNIWIEPLVRMAFHREQDRSQLQEAILWGEYIHMPHVLNPMFFSQICQMSSTSRLPFPLHPSVFSTGEKPGMEIPCLFPPAPSFSMWYAKRTYSGENIYNFYFFLEVYCQSYWDVNEYSIFGRVY